MKILTNSILNKHPALGIVDKWQRYKSTDDVSFTAKGVYSVAYLHYRDMQWLHYCVHSFTDPVIVVRLNFHHDPSVRINYRSM